NGHLALIQTQFGLPRGAVRPMAREAVVEQNGTHIAVVLRRDTGCVGGDRDSTRAYKYREAGESRSRRDDARHVWLPIVKVGLCRAAARRLREHAASRSGRQTIASKYDNRFGAKSQVFG